MHYKEKKHNHYVEYILHSININYSNETFVIDVSMTKKILS